MAGLMDEIRSALARGLPTRREKLLGGSIVVVALLVIARVLTPGWQLSNADREPPTPKSYWQRPLACHGPDFRDPPPDPDSPPGEPRGIFRMSDHVVLAIPRHYLGGPWDEHLPAAIARCSAISDLPKIHHLVIVIGGRWSGAYREDELLKDNNGELLYPDRLHLDVLPLDVGPVSNRAYITSHSFQPLTVEQNGILCSGNLCWVPMPQESDRYGSVQFVGGIETEPKITWLQINGMTYRELEIMGQVNLRNAFQTLPAMIASLEEHIDRWNIVRSQQTGTAVAAGSQE